MWGPCKDLSEVCAFLGMVGVCRIFIQNFTKHANALVHLTRKGIPFKFSADQLAAQEDLKQVLLNSLALWPIDYSSDSPVILAVDSSQVAMGFYLCQADLNIQKKHYYTRFGSLPLNDRECCFSQPKLELYGLYHALCAYKIFIVGVCNLIVKVDAQYIKGMLNNPDISPSASINRWIVSILTFHFNLRHVPGKHHGPDGLLRHPPQPGNVSDSNDEEDFDDWIDNLYSFIHMINNPISAPQTNQLLYTLTTKVACRTADMDDELITEPNYHLVPRSITAVQADKRLEMAHDWLAFLDRLPNMPDQEYANLVHFTSKFFIDDGVLWKRDPQGAHKWVIYKHHCLEAINAAHDDVGHRGFYATQALVMERYWWPFMGHDIAWYVCMCHLSSSSNLSSLNSTCCRNSGTAICEDVHGYNAPPLLWQLLLHCTRPMLINPLPRVPHALQGDRTGPQQLDLSRCTMPLGHIGRDCIGQWKAICSHSQLPRVQVPHQAHPDQWLQLLRKWHR